MKRGDRDGQNFDGDACLCRKAASIEVIQLCDLFPHPALHGIFFCINIATQVPYPSTPNSRCCSALLSGTHFFRTTIV